MERFCDKKEVVDLIFDKKIIAIIRRIDRKKILDVVNALIEGGIQLIEVSFTEKDAPDLIKVIRDAYKDKICVGAGTVLNQNQIEKAIESGARYIITPVLLEDIIKRCKEEDICVIPGAFSPTEVYKAYELGADIVKVFPASSLGSSFFKNIKSPLPHIPLAAVGGIDITNLKSFVEAGADVIGVGSNLFPKQLIEENNFKAIKELAEKYVCSVKV